MKLSVGKEDKTEVLLFGSSSLTGLLMSNLGGLLQLKNLGVIFDPDLRFDR